MNQQPPLNREGITPEVALQKFEESLLLDKELTLLYRIIKDEHQYFQNKQSSTIYPLDLPRCDYAADPNP